MAIGELARRAAYGPRRCATTRRRGSWRLRSGVNGQRRYAETALEQLRVIRLCKAMGFDLGEIRALVHREEDRGTYEQLAARKLAELDTVARSLDAARVLLQHALVCGCSSPRECSAAPMPAPDLSALARTPQASLRPAAATPR
jgi:hypothetical protein